jgi:hypothetical protein
MPEIPVAHWWRTLKKTPATLASILGILKALIFSINRLFQV